MAIKLKTFFYPPSDKIDFCFAPPTEFYLPIDIFLWGNGIGHFFCVDWFNGVQRQLYDETVDCRVFVDCNYVTQNLKNMNGNSFQGLMICVIKADLLCATFTSKRYLKNV